MEENKKDKKEVRSKQLTYEQLEAAAKQISVQLDATIKENQQLKGALNKLQLNNLYTELDFRFKVIQFASVFDTVDPSFVTQCIKAIQAVMTPSDTNTSKEEENGEIKG